MCEHKYGVFDGWPGEYWLNMVKDVDISNKKIPDIMNESILLHKKSKIAEDNIKIVRSKNKMTEELNCVNL